MLLILLKSSVCLALLMLFYKIALEPLSFHKFKRIYLLAALIVAAIIPFITFIKYVDPTLDFGYYDPSSLNTPPYFPADLPPVIEEEPSLIIPTLLWSVYGIGVLVFLIRFSINLYHISVKIKRHQKVKKQSFIHVLIEKLAIPHTFLNFIFINKLQFQNNQIPEQVLLHEQAHAQQKHSLDILFIELLQVVFWFNPLLYFIKKDIKLNHEFLADQAVLNSGFKAKDYKNLLLRFSSNQQELALVNAINYSSIKKRFTIMNTQTSPKTKWLRSLLLLPLLAALLFSFSETKEVEKELTPAIFIQDQSNGIVKDIEEKLEKTGELKINYTNPILEVKQNPFSLKLNGKPTSLQTLKEDFIKATNGKKSDLRIEANGAVDHGFIKDVMAEITKAYLLKIKLSENSFIEDKTDYSSQNSKITQELQPMLGQSVFNGYPIVANLKAIINSEVAVTTGQTVTSFKFKVPGKPTVLIKGTTLNSEAINNLKQSKDGTIFQYFDIKVEDGSKVPSMTVKLRKLIEEVEIKNQSSNQYPEKETKRLQNLRQTYTKYYSKKYPESAQGNIVEVPEDSLKKFIKKQDSLKNIPPPPPPPPAKPKTTKIKISADKNSAPVIINGKTFYYKTENGDTKYYNRWGAEVDKNGKAITPLPPPPPPVPANASEEAKAKYRKVHKDYEAMKREYEKQESLPNVKTPPPPPPPKSPLDHAVEMAKKGASFFYNGEKVTSDKAIQLLKENKNLNISTNTNNGVSTVHISDKPIKIVNGKVVND